MYKRQIGYFHQRIFQYIADCHVPDNGKEGGWDVIFQRNSGIVLPDGDMVHRVYVEMKNKHNTCLLYTSQPSVLVQKELMNLNIVAFVSAGCSGMKYDVCPSVIIDKCAVMSLSLIHIRCV